MPNLFDEGQCVTGLCNDKTVTEDGENPTTFDDWKLNDLFNF